MPTQEDALYDILVPKNKQRAVDMDSFADLYGATAVEKDKALLQERGAQSAPDRSHDLFAAIVNDQIEQSDWMGPSEKAIVVVTSPFDQLENGIDSVIELSEGDSVSHLALTVDIANNEEEIQKKFSAIRLSIEQGKLSCVKYFHSKDFRGELENIARVVIGADDPVIEEVSGLLLRLIQLPKMILEDKRPEDAEELTKTRIEVAAHPLKRMILIEIKEQLEAFRAYAESLGKMDSMGEYSKVLHVIGGIIVEKEIAGETIGGDDLMKDKIFKMIVEGARSFGKAV